MIRRLLPRGGKEVPGSASDPGRGAAFPQPLFGTDGVRGRVGENLTPELALGLARAAADGSSGVAVIGRDTRASGSMLSAALHAGFNAGGLDTVDVGVLPVGGVSLHTVDLAATFGVMVSASHNPAEDNGIKFFGADGSKLDAAAEAAIAERFLAGPPWPEAAGGAVGAQRTMNEAAARYLSDLVDQAGFTAHGMPVVVDAAHGAAFETAPELLRRLGMRVEAINIEPTGMNINAGCGAVHPEALRAAGSGRIGLAFDGDADRCIAVDEDGEVCDGDVIMAVLARWLLESGRLPKARVVTTVMANLGFRVAMERLGIEVVETPVGDRHVLEAMRAGGAALGGEQSGHVVFGGRPTGDGLLTGLRLLQVVAETGTPLRELRTVMERYPQVLLNVSVTERGRLGAAAGVWAAVDDARRRLGEGGRVLVRESGTEPLVRVMVEAVDATEAEVVARELAAVVEQQLGASGN